MAEVIVLCYHAVSPTWDATLAVRPDLLERQLTVLRRQGWRGATFREAVLDPPAERTLAVTFDDAFASVRSLAYPILASLGLPGTVFAPSAFISTGQPLSWAGIDHWLETPSASELESLSWDDLGRLAHEGWEVGSHTRTHPHLTQLDERALRSELEQSRAEISERLGISCDTIAYPYGDVDPRVAQATQAAGYVAGAALGGPLTPLGPARWPRIGIYHADSMWRFKLKANRAIRRLRAGKYWPTHPET
jgi:peptidoglycan/xylan/chitin deacetylase (PgdA/CDA1 family)